MKKSMKITLIVAAALVGLGLCLSVAGFALGGRFSELRSLRFDSATGQWQTAGTAEPEVVGDYTGDTVTVPTNGIMSLDVDWTAGDVNILLTDGDEITVTETVNRKVPDNCAMSVKNEGGTLKIRYTGEDMLDMPNMAEKELTVRLPRSMNLPELHLSGVSADFNVAALPVRDTFTFDTVSGELKTGMIDNCTTAEINTVSGKVQLEGSFSEISAGSTSGEIDLTLRSLPGRVDISTVSGSVDMELAADNVGFTVDYSTVSGDLESDFAMKMNGDGMYEYGGGVCRIAVSTTSGDLKIETID